MKKLISKASNNQLTYPQVFYPALIQSFLQQQQLIYPRYRKPQYPQSLWDFSVNQRWVKYLGLIGLFLLAMVIIVKGLSPSAIAFGLISWGVVVWLMHQFVQWWHKQRRRHRKQYELQYQQQLKQWRRAMKVRDRYFKNAKRHQRNQIEQRRRQLKELSTDKVEQPIADSNAPKGVSETMFLEVLRTVLPDAAFGGEFPIPGFDYPYSMDLVFIDKNTGLSIDIEIDEPYEGKSKKPHHCCDNNKDRNRNRFFNDRNWVVVRFAEEQIVRNPQGCCRYLAEIVAQITQDESLITKVKDLPKLNPVKAWTKTEAKQMAEWKVREKYLEETGVYRPYNFK